MEKLIVQFGFRVSDCEIRIGFSDYGKSALDFEIEFSAIIKSVCKL